MEVRLTVLGEGLVESYEKKPRGSRGRVVSVGEIISATTIAPNKISSVSFWLLAHFYYNK